MNALLLRLRWKTAWRCFASGDLIRFRPGVNLIVGDQGSGKSTLLEAIREKSRPRKTPLGANTVRHVAADKCSLWINRTRPIQAVQFDFEHDNPRMKSAAGTICLTGDFEAYTRIAATQARSHGEFVRTTVESLPARVKDPSSALLVALDEPDTGLSGRSILRLAAVFDELAAAGAQVIAAVHNPWLIESQPEVLSLEHRRWMPPAEFLDTWRRSPETKREP